MPKDASKKKKEVVEDLNDEVEIDDAKLDLGDQWGMKRKLDEEAAHYLAELGYETDWRLWNAKMLLGLISCICAAVAQFWPAEYPKNKMVLLLCCGIYYGCGVILQYLTTFRENGWFVFTTPHPDAKWSTTQGIALTSSMERYEYEYTMTIDAIPVRLPPRAEHGRAADVVLCSHFVLLTNDGAPLPACRRTTPRCRWPAATTPRSSRRS